MSDEWCEVAGRRVKICTGKKSQSINVCFGDAPREGQYEYRYKTWDVTRLAGHDIELQAFETIEALQAFLISRKYQDVSDEATRGRVWAPLAPDVQWGGSQKAEIEKAVNHLVDCYLSDPYRHRVEHSLHCDLFQLLEEIPAIREARIAVTERFNTRLVHKEWPETQVRTQKTGRGNFDLAVLTPVSGGEPVGSDRFLGGHIQPYAAFELGLDYDRDHFLGDVTKLRHSRIDAGYVIHFARPQAADQEQVRECLEELEAEGHDGKDGWPSLVVAILSDRQEPFVKRLGV